ncbi:Cysteine-rich receptor-like protein kinase 10 [Hordeum vulgare]|nr:Cysteine-rich receptor-like protein kinase 10 [Hordeum vulgare]
MSPAVVSTPRGDAYGGSPRPHVRSRPRAHQGRQLAAVGVPGAPLCLPPSRQLMNVKAHGDGVLEEIVAHRRGHEEGDVVILDDNDEEALGPSNPVCHGDPGQGCNKDGGGLQDDDGSEYNNFYRLLGM